MRSTVAIVASLGALVPGLLAQQATFRTSTDAVLVHALVRQGSRSVSDLNCNEFELRDNGVLQSLENCSYDSMPLDMTLLSDMSQSVWGPVLQRIRRSGDEAKALALPIDRVRSIGFASVIREISAEYPLDIPTGVDRGHTALIDAIASALMLPADPGRRRIAFVLTDGLDSNSAIPKELVQGIVDRADTILHIFAIAETRPDWMSMVYRNKERDYFWFLRDLAQRSGGTFHDLTPDDNLEPAIEHAISDVRTRYLLRYVPQDVSRQGWHAIDVQVKRAGRYSITARRGYQRGG